MPPEQKEKLNTEFNAWFQEESKRIGMLVLDKIANWFISRLDEALAEYKQGLVETTEGMKLIINPDKDVPQTTSAHVEGYNQGLSDILAIINKK